MSILDIRNLSVGYDTEQQMVYAVDDVTLAVTEGQSLGLIGESGCGKTTLMRSIVRVMSPNARVLAGEVLFRGRDLLKLTPREMRALRWREIAFIPQASMDSLDPVKPVGRQLETVLKVRGDFDRRTAKVRSVELFDMVGLDIANLDRYPHEFSGGMKQRAIIAMALALNPILLIADEPVTALDVIVQHQVLDVFKRLQSELNLTVMLITHDISVVAQVCDSVAVMYAGQIVEQAQAAPFFQTPYHPYSLGLQNAFPNLVNPKQVLIAIDGYPPDLVDPPSGCRFAERCPFAIDVCRQTMPHLEEIEPTHPVACFRAHEMAELRPQAADPALWLPEGVLSQIVDAPVRVSVQQQNGAMSNSTSDKPNGAGHFVAVDHLTKQYRIGGGLGGLVRGQPAQLVHAVNGISFQLRKGESLGLAGESGCGKTTTGKLLVKLLEATTGEIKFDGENVANLRGYPLKQYRRRVQFMFQNPFEALNPRFTLYRSLSEPLIIGGWQHEAERRRQILVTLERVNLRPPEAFLDKFPHQLSGGQLQRVVLARSLVLEPEFLIADEPVSMLDVSVRAGILNTMRGLAKEMDLTTVYISHDLSLLQYTCDRIAVMYLGHIVEIGLSEEVINNPQHPYTQALVSAVPVPDPVLPRSKPRIGDGSPQATNVPIGCPFQERCPEVMGICRERMPQAIEVGERHEVACFLYQEDSLSELVQ
ncbi:ABC transporter ATP-binding protein [Chloroflexi bacterium TSY]|nr:ABC transporter ATP-binding protein [Chloroflexi bacterium TSY]